MRIAAFVGLAMWTSLAFACKDKLAPVTRADCTAAAEHVADLIIADLASRPAMWWDELQAAPDPGIPKDITKDTFAAWLETATGRTWMLVRRGNTLVGVMQGVDPCVQNATRAQVNCLIEAKDKIAVKTCDAKYARPRPEGSGSSIN